MDRTIVRGSACLPVDWPVAAFGSTSALLTVAAAAVVVRRLAGALVQPLEAAPLLAAAASAILAAGGIRVLSRFGDVQRGSIRAFALQMAVSAAVVAFVGSLSIPGTAPSALAAAWFAVIGGELAGWWLFWRRPKGGAPIPQGVSRSPKGLDVAGERVEQRLAYVRGAAGEIQVRGDLAVPLAAGQRNVTAHVAFCPPLAGTPAIVIRPLSGPAARIKLGQVLPWGARFELKLNEAAQADCEVRFWFHAQLPPAARPGEGPERDHAPPSGPPQPAR